MTPVSRANRAGSIHRLLPGPVIQKHTLETTGGLTYAELDREDPLREVAMNSAFLQSSLFTSIVAFGVAAIGVGMGVVFILIGLGIRDVAERTTEPPTQV